MKKILVWHQGALGDLLLSLPAVHAIRKHEESYLHLVCRPDLADVVLRNRIADETSSNEQGIFADLFSSTPPQEELRLFLRKFSAAFVFMKKLDPDFFA